MNESNLKLRLLPRRKQFASVVSKVAAKFPNNSSLRSLADTFCKFCYEMSYAFVCVCVKVYVSLANGVCCSSLPKLCTQ